MNDSDNTVNADPIEQQDQPAPHYRPWVGVVASILIAGAGQYLAGKKTRGLCWFALYLCLGFAHALVETVPTMFSSALAWTEEGLYWAIGLFMLYDSYRPIPRMRVRGWVVLVLISIVLTITEMFVFWCFVRPFKIPTRTMEPTLRGQLRRPDGTVARETGDHVWVQRFAYWFNKPGRGDIVVFRTRGLEGTRGDFYCKRVVGLPGERLSIKAGKLYVNGAPVSDPPVFKRLQYVQPASLAPKYLVKETEEFVVLADHYFVLGDNSAHSQDSRYYGPVPEANLVGKVTKIFSPPARAGIPE